MLVKLDTLAKEAESSGQNNPKEALPVINSLFANLV